MLSSSGVSDRWFRNLSDFYKVQDILDNHNVRWISTSEPGINMETRDGRLQLNVVLSIGQNEVDTTSERIKFVNEASIRSGKLIFGDVNMGYGYKSGIVDGQKRMIKDPDREHVVDAFYKYFFKHQNKCATLRYIQETYDPDFSFWDHEDASFQRILQRYIQRIPLLPCISY